MLSDVPAFIRYFETVHRRTIRDVAALPPGAADWRAPSDMGEGLWSLGEIVGHIGSSRLMFAGAFAGRGWHLPDQAFDPGRQEGWIPRLAETWAQMRQWLESAPADALERRVETMDRSAQISGWRVLMLLLEHEIHHRSQLDAYAGLAGWQVPDLFGFSFQQVQEYAGREASQG